MIRPSFTLILLATVAAGFTPLLNAAEPKDNPLQHAQTLAMKGDHHSPAKPRLISLNSPPWDSQFPAEFGGEKI